jgi:hypothetical protein
MPFNNLKARPEHLEKLLKSLKGGKTLTPNDIVKNTGLSLTAVYGAISHLELSGKIGVERQNKTPKMRVSLRQN